MTSMGVPLAMLASDWFSCYCFVLTTWRRYPSVSPKSLIHSRTLTYDQKIRIKYFGRPVQIFKFEGKQHAGMYYPTLDILFDYSCVAIQCVNENESVFVFRGVQTP